MCLSKCINDKNNSFQFLNESFSREGITDRYDYIETIQSETVPTCNKYLSVVQLNIRGLVNKQDQVKQFLTNCLGINKVDVG